MPIAFVTFYGQLEADVRRIRALPRDIELSPFSDSPPWSARRASAVVDGGQSEAPPPVFVVAEFFAPGV